MQNYIATIALDVDGVLLDCDGGFATVAEHLLGRSLPKLNNSYELDKRYGITQQEVYNVFEEMKTHPEGWGGMAVLPQAIAAAKLLQDNGYRVELVTAIPEDLKEMRLACLAAYGFVPDAIHCAGHHLASKQKIVEKMDPIMIVDDRLKHLKDCSFVPNLVWVDHGDEQDGLEYDENTVFKVNSLMEWVTYWMDNYHPKAKTKNALSYS